MRAELKRRSSVTGAASLSELTEVLLRVRQGDERALDRLFTLVYNDLRDLAKSYLARYAGANK